MSEDKKRDEKADENPELRFAEEWALELAGEVITPSKDRLPIIPDRVEIAELVASEDEREKLAFRTLYETGMRESEFLELGKDQLADGFLSVAGRKVLITPKTLTQLNQLADSTKKDAKIFGWEVAELRKRLRARARKTGLMDRYEPIDRKLMPAVFRHACGVHLVENGMDIYLLKALLGYSSIYTSFRIQQMAVGTCRESYERCHPLAKVPAVKIGPKRRSMAATAAGFFKSMVSGLFNLKMMNLVMAPMMMAPPMVVPVEKDPHKGSPADLDPAQMKTLMGAAKDDRERMLARLFYASAARVSSTAELHYLDVFYDERRLFLREAKGDVDLYALIDQGTADMLRMWQGTEPISDSVFELSTRSLNRLISEMGERSGLQEQFEPLGESVSPHCFRHAFATHVYEAGMELYHIQKLLGHSSLAVTDQYIFQHFKRHQDVYRRIFKTLKEPDLLH